MTTDLLEQRLRNLSVRAPDAGCVSARALAAAPRRRRLTKLRIAAAPVALVLLAALVAYLAPATDTAVANVPFAGDLLRDAGLAGVRDRITSVGDTTTSSGYTIRLIGAYADSTRTVLLVRSNPPSLPGYDVQLTDQFGRTYHPQDGTGDMRTGEESMQFEPLAWPDSLTGARITLHMTTVQAMSEALGPTHNVSGDWTLHATLGVDESTSLPLPAPATLGKARFRFTSVTYTPASIGIQLVETGLTPEELEARIPDGGKGTAAFDIELLDPSGQIINGTWGWSATGPDSVKIDFLAYRLGGAGRHVLLVSYVGQGGFEQELTIP